MLLAVIEQRDADSEAYAMEVLGQDAGQRLPSIPDFARRNRGKPELAKLFTVLVAESLEPESPGHGHFVARYRALRAIVAAMIASAQQDGRVRADIDPRLKAAEILATLDGLQTQWLLDPDEVDIAKSAEAYAQTLEHDLRS